VSTVEPEGTGADGDGHSSEALGAVAARTGDGGTAALAGGIKMAVATVGDVPQRPADAEDPVAPEEVVPADGGCCSC
jgi:hypothetical protein